MAFNVICKAISKVFNSSPPFSGLRFDFNTPETAGQGDVTVYPYHPRIKQRIRAGELIGYYWDDNYLDEPANGDYSIGYWWMPLPEKEDA